MKHPTRWTALILGIVSLAGLCLVFTLSAGQAAQLEKRSRSDFMRQKLEFSKNVLEGLSLEHYGIIEKNARSLKLLSQAAEWEVPVIPNATDYVALTSEFQRYADELIKNARESNIDGATLAYLKLTMNCVQCHKFVRFAAK